MQYTWSPQAASWNMFWSRPENPCRVYGRCGSLGVCVGGGLNPCSCPPGLRPVDPVKWGFGDFFGGCSNGAICHISDEGSTFYEMGPVEVDASVTTVYSGVSRSFCEDSCRENCSCFGLIYNSKSRVCTNLYESAYNLRNSTTSPVLYLKILPGNSYSTKRARRKWKVGIIVGILCAIAVNLIIAVGLGLTMLCRRRLRPRHGETRRRSRERRDRGDKPAGFHLQGALSSDTRVFGEGRPRWLRRGVPRHAAGVNSCGGEAARSAGRRRPRVPCRSSHHRERAAREPRPPAWLLFEDPHRLLVYEYMPNGSLSAYLGRGRTLPALSWPARFRVALGTARGIAYLHEECRDCIIHCDIKPENILLDGDFTPKVSDFGLAKLVGRDLSRVLATTRGTWGYVAPEWLSGVAITAKADVYSYGMTLLEIIGGRRNVEVPAVETDAKEGQERWFFAPWAAKRIVEGDISAVVEEGVEGYNEIEAERAGRWPCGASRTRRRRGRPWGWW
ncbi:hypothetical protein HPP92_025790 [Vanilla planifolia]|uniref:Uncharacterized protein n=1 Tax=Vanilla planifolia TaxID=51239 RepID=A0A835PG10_VANPL|nr:hypothetical protein HPP92_025790 [Vanilla planifolia]